MDLGKQIEDKELLDRHGRRAGKVDDLVLEVPELSDEGDIVDAPEVVGIISGPTALARNLPRPIRALVLALYRLLGLADPRPVEIPYDRVTAIDVVVHADIDRKEAGLTALAGAVDRRIIGRLPGANVRP